jgi:CheY-like chemotaxis protein
MAHTKRLLVLARLDPEQKRVLGVTATANELELFVLESVDSALTWLERNQPRLVVFDTALPKADKLCAKVRSKKALALVPIIGIAAEINDALAPKLYGMGADDLIPPAFGSALMARLRAMPKEASLHPPPDRGKAVVADADKTRGDVFGRVLANAGYDVKFALDELSLKFYAQQTDIKVVVANGEIGDPGALITQARQAGSKAAWIVTAQRRDLESFAAKLAPLASTRVMGLGAPPENVLFTSNELLSAGTRPARHSPRLLYATTVLFRDSGADLDELGSTYNVSAGGLYVRTMAPAPNVPVWLELRPPRSKQWVRLEGRVAWQRPFHQAAGATVPPGFGVELTAGLGSALAAWREGYAALGEQEAAARRAPPPPPRPAPLRARVAPPSAPEKEPIEELGEAEFLPATEPPPPPAQSPAAPPPPSDVLLPIPAMAKVPEIAAPPAAAAPEPIAPAMAEPRPGRSRSRLWLWLLLVTGLVGGVAAAVVATTPPTAPAPEPIAPTAPTPSMAEAATVESDAMTPDPASGADATSAAQAASADASAEPETPAAELLANQGYLFVEAEGAFDVYATGVKIGPSNQTNLSRCGLRYVRLGEGDPVRWRSGGHTVDVKCQDTTRVTIAVTP